jgi:hypothetical protein
MMTRIHSICTLMPLMRLSSLMVRIFLDRMNFTTGISTVITALNLSNFAENGPLPDDHIPKHVSFRSSELAPFASNVQFQCDYPLHSTAMKCLLPS